MVVVAAVRGRGVVAGLAVEEVADLGNDLLHVGLLHDPRQLQHDGRRNVPHASEDGLAHRPHRGVVRLHHVESALQQVPVVQVARHAHRRGKIARDDALHPLLQPQRLLHHAPAVNGPVHVGHGLVQAHRHHVPHDLQPVSLLLVLQHVVLLHLRGQQPSKPLCAALPPIVEAPAQPARLGEAQAGPLCAELVGQALLVVEYADTALLPLAQHRRLRLGPGEDEEKGALLLDAVPVRVLYVDLDLGARLVLRKAQLAREVRVVAPGACGAVHCLVVHAARRAHVAQPLDLQAHLPADVQGALALVAKLDGGHHLALGLLALVGVLADEVAAAHVGLG
mmetsp:Transcript_7585/g.14908  ORF Transcript_7585/g.14908 Transcript_7585/m.14908 type:complete len:337 (-) Transcript_7585:838-1848(-)